MFAPRRLRRVAAAVSVAGLLAAGAPVAEAGILDTLFGSAGSSGATGTTTGRSGSGSSAGQTTRPQNTHRTSADIPQWTTPLSDPPEVLKKNASFGQYTSNHPDDWGWLKTSPRLQPGAKIIRDSSNRLACSAGWILNSGKARYLLTAGHCGATVDNRQQNYKFALPKQDPQHHNESLPPFGTLVESSYTNSVRDYALIELNGNITGSTGPDTQKLYTNTVINRDLMADLTQVDTPLSVDLLVKDSTWLCHLGQATGLSCGTFQGFNRAGMITFKGMVNVGDSGGPVFAVDNKHIYPVGILSSAEDTTASIRLMQAQSIIGVMLTKTNLYWGDN